MYTVDLSAFLLRRPRQDFLMGLFTAQLFWGGVAFAQRTSTSFGLYTDTRLRATPSSVLVFSPRTAKSPLILVGSSESSAILKFRMTKEGRLESAGRIRGPFPVCQLAAVHTTGDRERDIIALSADGHRVGFLNLDGTRKGVLGTELEQCAERFIVSDIDNDGQPEILLFGRTMTGVATVNLSGDPQAKEGPQLFPDLSVSDMVALDMNGDDITDVAICHWLSNRLIVRFGIGGGVFSNQASLDLPSEPDRLSLTTVSRRHTMRMLVTLPESRSVAHLIGFPSGELAVREILPVPHQPTGVKFALINDDFLPDMVCATEGGFAVSLGVSAFSFAGTVEFGAGADAVSWSTDDVHGDGRVDLAFVQTPARLAVLSNARTSHEDGTTRCYATGTSPTGLLLQDFDDDGLIDVAIANRGSGTISIFHNRGNGALDGQRCIDVYRSPECLYPVRSSGNLLVAEHPKANVVSVIRLSDSVQGPGPVAIPTGSNPQVILAERSPASEGLRILLRYADADDARAPIAVVERLRGDQFAERSFRWPPRLTVAALTTGAISGNAQGDLIMALRDGRSRATSIALAAPFDGFDYRRFVTMFTLPDSLGAPLILASGYIDRDSCEDLALVTGPPMYAFGVAHGTADRRLAPPQHWLPGVLSADRPPLVLVDADGDGVTDVVYLDDSSRTVRVMYGKGNGEFLSPAIAVNDGTIGSIGVAPLFGGSSNDLVTTNKRSHTVTVHRGVFHR